VIFSSTKHGCEFERRVGDDKQFGKPKGLFWGLDIRVSFFDVQEERMSRVHRCEGVVASQLKGETITKQETPA